MPTKTQKGKQQEDQEDQEDQECKEINNAIENLITAIDSFVTTNLGSTKHNLRLALKDFACKCRGYK